MAVPFDHIATTDDSILAQSAIGQLQRKLVWDYLEKIMPELTGLEILELNCGRGEDALLFSEKGFNIVATDISEEMLKITQHKEQQYSMQHKISSYYLDLDSVDETVFNKKFDLIFSNFGGLNGIHPESLQKLLQKIPMVLSPGGRFVAVVMPRFCLWESAYFLTRFRFGKIFHRWTKREVFETLNGVNQKAWFYKPAQIKRWSKDAFKVMNIKPIGFALPPVRLENFFSARKRLLLRLNKLELKLSSISYLSGMSDNFLIDLRLT
jgi:ubiquinone/menaquinone biosynthesis C-methylase UbiE